MATPGYIYVGQYFHRHGKDLSGLTEKKIGKSIDVPKRELALNSTKFTIGYSMIKYWKVPDMDKTEKALHAILPNRLNGEWFEDADETLIDRLDSYMYIEGGVDQTMDLIDFGPDLAKLIARPDRARVSELSGQQFSYTREGVSVTIEITPEGKFKDITTNKVFTSPGQPFTENWLGKISGATTLNGWTSPKNLQGNCIDIELEMLPNIPEDKVT